MAPAGNPASAEPLGVIRQVNGEVYIERAGERIPAIGSAHLQPGDRLISVNGGSS